MTLLINIYFNLKYINIFTYIYVYVSKFRIWVKFILVRNFFCVCVCFADSALYVFDSACVWLFYWWVGMRFELIYINFCLAQSGQMMSSASVMKPRPTKDVLHIAQMKQSLCQWRSSKEMKRVPPMPETNTKRSINTFIITEIF